MNDRDTADAYTNTEAIFSKDYQGNSAAVQHLNDKAFSVSRQSDGATRSYSSITSTFVEQSQGGYKSNKSASHTLDILEIVQEYKDCPELLRLLLQSKIEEEKRKSEEFKLQRVEMEYKLLKMKDTIGSRELPRSTSHSNFSTVPTTVYVSNYDKLLPTTAFEQNNKENVLNNISQHSPSVSHSKQGRQFIKPSSPTQSSITDDKFEIDSIERHLEDTDLPFYHESSVDGSDYNYSMLSTTLDSSAQSPRANTLPSISTLLNICHSSNTFSSLNSRAALPTLDLASKDYINQFIFPGRSDTRLSHKRSHSAQTDHTEPSCQEKDYLTHTKQRSRSFDQSMSYQRYNEGIDKTVNSDLFKEEGPEQLPIPPNPSPFSPPTKARRKNNKIQPVTMIIETKEHPYYDEYTWKNNGSTMRNTRGRRSIYYKCANSTLGCPVNKTVTFNESGTKIIKYRGYHLKECTKVKHVKDV